MNAEAVFKLSLLLDIQALRRKAYFFLDLHWAGADKITQWQLSLHRFSWEIWWN